MFFLSFLVVYPILFLLQSLSFILILFFNHGLYTSFHIHFTFTFILPLLATKTNYQPLPPKKHFYNHFLTLELSFLEKQTCYNNLFYYYLPKYLPTKDSLFLYLLFQKFLGLVVYLRISIFVRNIQNCFFFFQALHIFHSLFLIL